MREARCARRRRSRRGGRGSGSLDRVDSRASAPLRLTASRATLVRAAIGGPRQVAGKLARIARTLGLWLRPREIDARLARLEARGYVHSRPTRLQLLFGSLDMLRFVIEPA